MTSKKYLTVTCFLVTIIAGCLLSINIYLNEFGLFAARSKIRIWYSEKTSKYLFSFKYIPDNFDGVIIGASASANLDTRKIRCANIYNLSMNGANISELKYAADNVLSRGKIKYMIICLYPYLTKNSGRKGCEINPKEYLGSIFSFLPFKVELAKIRMMRDREMDPFHSSEWGYNDFNILKKQITFSDVVKNHRYDPRIIIDPVAYLELKKVIDVAHSRNVQILAYYYPIFHEFYLDYERSGAWRYYQIEMGKLFGVQDIVWDMNLPEYYHITKDFNSYSDGHLSNAASDLVVRVIEEHLNYAKMRNTRQKCMDRLIAAFID